jgi:hypothetical protein
MKIGSHNELISNALHTKCLGLTIDSTLSWKTHIDHLIIKLSTACYVIRFPNPYMSHINDLLFSFSFCHELWNNILGEFLSQYKHF